MFEQLSFSGAFQDIWKELLDISLKYAFFSKSVREEDNNNNNNNNKSQTLLNKALQFINSPQK